MFEDFYGLTGKPFQLTPDPQFYFESLTHRKALSYLGYGLAQGDPAEAAKWGGGALILPWLLSKGHTSPAVINYLSRPQGAISRAITDQVLPRIGQIGGGLMAPGGE